MSSLTVKYAVMVICVGDQTELNKRKKGFVLGVKVGIVLKQKVSIVIAKTKFFPDKEMNCECILVCSSILMRLLEALYIVKTPSNTIRSIRK